MDFKLSGTSTTSLVRESRRPFSLDTCGGKGPETVGGIMSELWSLSR